ncbi:MAG: response regulator transcription factor [Ignavibacteria bacterium]|jgi:DNA-binding NarL/FixJ family response regulator
MKKKESTERIKIIIIDDHPLFREGIKTIINRDCRFIIAGESGTGNEGFQLVKKLEPDLVIIDISLPDINGIQILREIKEEFPQITAVILSMHSESSNISKAFNYDASGYLVKESASGKLIECIETVLKGGYYLDNLLSKEVVSFILGSSKDKPKTTNNRYNKLTAREQEIMRYIVTGNSNKEIAQKLYISPKTVRNHSSNIMHKLELKNSFELMKYAAKIGLIDTESFTS